MVNGNLICNIGKHLNFQYNFGDVLQEVTYHYIILNYYNLQNHYKLKQIVNFPIRCHNTLDLILTNIENYYDSPIKRSSFGLSDLSLNSN